jgi:Rrf2 family protein
LKLSSAVKYGIQATVELARSDPERRVPLHDLARRGEMPERFLNQVLRSLVSSGILRSYHGNSGGYRLARAPDTITLLDIIDSVDAPHEPDTSKLRAVPADKRKRIEHTLSETWEAARHELNKLTIAELVGTRPGMHKRWQRHTSPK